MGTRCPWDLLFLDGPDMSITQTTDKTFGNSKYCTGMLTGLT